MNWGLCYFHSCIEGWTGDMGGVGMGRWMDGWRLVGVYEFRCMF